MKEWKANIAGKNEEPVMACFDSWGYVLGEDYVRQYPIADMYIVDFAFVPEQIAIEVDGDNHKQEKQRGKDLKRDRYLKFNNWVVIRIPERHFFKNPSFYRYLIHEVVEERRKHLIKTTETFVDIE